MENSNRNLINESNTTSTIREITNQFNISLIELNFQLFLKKNEQSIMELMEGKNITGRDRFVPRPSRQEYFYEYDELIYKGSVSHITTEKENVKSILNYQTIEIKIQISNDSFLYPIQRELRCYRPRSQMSSAWCQFKVGSNNEEKIFHELERFACKLLPSDEDFWCQLFHSQSEEIVEVKYFIQSGSIVAFTFEPGFPVDNYCETEKVG